MYFEPNTQSSHAYKKVQQNEYKKAKTGNSPTEWTVYQMKDLYTERKEPGKEELPVLSVSIHDGISDDELDEDELGKKIRRIADKSQYKRVKPGDLVFNMMRAWQGAIGVVKTEGMVSPAYIVATPNDQVYPPFMDHYMKTPRMIGIINRQSYGVTDFRKRLYWDSFAPINCAIPSIVEQQRISEILALQDRIIELKEKLIAEKQQQKKYLMQQLLTGKKRLPGFNRDWKRIKLKDISMFSNKHEKSTYETYVSTENMRSNYEGVLFEKGNLESVEGIKYYKNNVLVGNIRPYLKKVWKSDREGVCSADVLVLQPYFVDSLFFYYLIANDSFFDYIAIGSKGSKMPRGDKKHILDMNIWIPISPEEQEAIAAIFAIQDREITLLKMSMEFEKQKKKALMQLLLTGLVRVKV